MLSDCYSGMLKAQLITPVYEPPINTLHDIIKSGLPVEIVDYVEYEGSFSQNRDDPNVAKIFDNRIDKEFSPFIEVKWIRH